MCAQPTCQLASRVLLPLPWFGCAQRRVASFAMPGLWVEGFVSEEHGLNAWSTLAGEEMPRGAAPEEQSRRSTHGRGACLRSDPCLRLFVANPATCV